MLAALRTYVRLLGTSRRNRADLWYDMMGRNAVLFDGSSYLNLGYWRDTADYGEACRAMIDQVADAARIGPGSRVLDAGCGFGDQDFHLATTRNPAHIEAINITRSQLDHAVAQFSHPEIRFRACSATELDVAPSSLDAVISVEAAFHFDTREAFLRQAHAALRPGGRLAVADVLPRERDGQLDLGGLRLRFERQVLQVPAANLYGISGYRAVLEACGFTDISVTSIREQVFPGYLAHLARLRRDPMLARRLDPLMRHVLPHLGDPFVSTDYVLVAAARPG